MSFNSSKSIFIIVDESLFVSDINQESISLKISREEKNCFAKIVNAMELDN